MNKTLTAPLFLLMHGLPAAGKSAFARQYAETSGMAHINSDRIRFELYDDMQFTPSENKTVFRLTSYMAQLLLERRESLVFDMNLPSLAMRREMKALAARYGFNFAIVWVQTDREEAMRRTASRDRRRPDDKYSPAFGQQTFDRLADKSGQPNPERETVAVVSGQQPFIQQQRLADHKLLSLGFKSSGQDLAKNGRVDFSRRTPADSRYGGRRD